jgi:hypothetical protein
MGEAPDADWILELRRLAEASAPGPWHVGSADDEAFMSAEFVSTEEADNAWPPERSVVAITQLQLPRYAGNERSEENSRFIAAARMGVPRLCDRLERAFEERAALARGLRELLDVAQKPSGDAQLGEAIERAQRLLKELGAG